MNTSLPASTARMISMCASGTAFLKARTKASCSALSNRPAGEPLEDAGSKHQVLPT